MKWLLLLIVLFIVFLYPWLIEMLAGNPDPTDRIHPGPKKANPVKKTYVIQNKPDWYTSRGLGMVDKEIEAEVIESQFSHKIKTERNPKLSDNELAAIEQEGLDINKASRAKIFWAQNKSTKETEKEIKEHGYGYRTLDKYWSIFYYFHSGGGAES